MRLKKGFIHVYTGEGKGKTTASFGLALRASGAGLDVYVMQFIKGRVYNELKAIKKIKNITFEQCGRGCFVRKRPTRIDEKCAKDGLEKVKQIIKDGKYGLIILDEINYALNLGLLNEEEVVSLLKNRPGHIEVVLTGRNCPKSILKIADYVTNMEVIKHPYEDGISARAGIEF